jgi:uncharacterized protein (UPF0262 family)
MEKLGLIDRLKEILSHEDLLPFNKEAHELKAKFAHLLMDKESVSEEANEELVEESVHDVSEEAQDAEIVEVEVAEEVAVVETDPMALEFDALYDDFKTRHKAQVEAKKSVEQANLELKKSLIDRLRTLIQEEENIGVAFAAQKEIQEQWREIGDIPRDLRQDIQNDYSRLMEQFYYNIGIYKELRVHDLKRNQQLKEEVIVKLKALAQNQNIQEIESELKVLQHEWEDIGGTQQEVWEELKASYWSIVKSLYDRIRNHYEAKREVMNKNLEAKRELVVKTEQTLNGVLDSSDYKVWEDATQELLKMQEEWKGIGFGPRKENEDIWNQFRGMCDKFFEAKHAFYKERNKQFDEFVTKKKALIAKVNELKESTNWKETTQQIIAMQNDWKKIGNAGPKNEQKLWKEFRAACDGFFNLKEAHFAEADAANADNLNLKLALIQEIETYEVKEDKQATLVDLRAFSTRFSEVGNVPFKEKDNVYNAFRAAMDKHYQALDLKGAEKEKVMFAARLDTLASSPQAGKMFDDERRKLRLQIQKAEQDIRQYENNLGFFSRSSKNNDLKKGVEKNIELARKTIQDCKNKLKLIPNE